MRRAWVVAAITLAAWTSGCSAESHPPVSVDPTMTRGPATAPVTIVEFSDYQ